VKTLQVTIGLLLSLGAIQAQAQDELSVTAIPWVQENPDIPHPAVNGRKTALQAIAEAGSCGNAYQYQWDINGDGDWDDPEEQIRDVNGNGFFAVLHLDIQYPDSPGDRLYYPKVRVLCGEESMTTVMPVQIRVDRICSTAANSYSPDCQGEQNLSLTRQVHTNRAVDRALWWMFRRYTHRADDGLGHDVQTCYMNESHDVYGTGHSMNAFLRRGHGHGPNRAADPYYRHLTQCGIHAFMANLRQTNFGEDANSEFGVTGKSLSFSNVLFNDSHTTSYVSTAWAEPFAEFGNPDYESPVGRDGVFGHTLRDIGQDVADELVRCQGSSGWWGYSCGQNITDCSTNGWAPESLRLLHRKLGSETYEAHKTSQRNKLNTGTGARGCLYGSWKHSLAGNGLVGYGWTENEIFDPNNANVTGLLQSVQNVHPNSYGLYYVYAATKGLRAFSPEIRYWPNGTDWNASYTDWFLNRLYANEGDAGNWNWTGSWSWGGYISQGSRTAMTTQILQTWLEAIAYPRAFPELASPGTEITIDHSWSYVLDPEAELVLYQWNVLNYPEGLDLDGDGAFEGEGEFAPEDLDGDGKVSFDEIVWEFETDDPNERFYFSYDDDLDWGESNNHKVTLAVTDNRGRVVYDDDAVEIQISLINHAPVIQAHPEGRDVVYRGYIGTEVIIDPRGTFDPDSEQEVFPGDEERPEGIQDRVTSLHMDLNFDGLFTEDEDAMENPARLTLREGMAIGDLIAVPIRACDDGQWNGECFDGIDADDCSLCAYGSAAIMLIRNTDPPDIDIGTCDPLTGECDPYNGDDGPVQLDLGDSYDPEGVFGLYFWYEVVEGDGYFEVAPEYEGNPNDMGPNPIYHPNPDGTRVDQILVTVTDHGGLNSEQIIEVTVSNQPPEIIEAHIDLEPRAPLMQDLGATNLGNGWYRAVVDADRDETWDAYMNITAEDPGGDPLNYEADMDLDGVTDLEGDTPRIGPFIYNSIQKSLRYEALARVFDDEGLSDELIISHEVPLRDSVLTYSLDLYGDGDFESVRGQDHIDFWVEPGVEQVHVAGTIYDSDGPSIDFDRNLLLDNDAPEFEVARILDIEEFDVVVTAAAVDPNGDDISYSIDWGDGSELTIMRGGLAEHSYADEYASYNIRITAEDGRGGNTSRDLQVEFNNNAPIIEDLRIVPQADWEIMVVIAASDPDEDPISYVIDWGDGTQSEGSSNVVAHTYPEGQYQTYEIQVTVRDIAGAEASGTTEHDFPEPPENQPPVIDNIEVRIGAAGNVELLTEAWDPEGDRLSYEIHWGDEADEETLAAMPGGNGEHQYDPADDPYVAYVVVTDEAGNQTNEEVEVLIIDNATEIRDASGNLIREGSVLVDVVAEDADGSENLVYSFDFDGDGVFEVEDQASSSSIHAYPEPGTYTIVVRVTDTWSGNSVEESVEIEVPPWIEDNLAPIIDNITLEYGGRGRMTLAITAHDPEGTQLAYEAHWGSEQDPEALAALGGPMGNHSYPFPAHPFSYEGFVQVTDAEGLSSRQPFTAEILDLPTDIRQVADSLIGEGRVLLTVRAEDGDGVDQLLYRFDFDNDGEWDTPDQATDSVVNSYSDPGLYTVRVRVTDTWSGVETEADHSFELLPWVGENQPPIIHNIEVTVGPAGLASVTVDASDPEGEHLSMVIHWGDEESEEALEPMAGAAATHSFAYDVDEETRFGYLLVTDPQGASARGEFEPEIVDITTVIREISISNVRDGITLINILASDEDSLTLRYSFDFESDDVWDIEEQADHSSIHAYDEAGGYTIRVSILDPWSGNRLTAERHFELEPWVESVPLADDHLEGEEGQCLVFRIGDDLSNLETKVDPTVCEREFNPGEELWHWIFGDGTETDGTEVGHRYLDDGIYDVLIEGGTQARPLQSSIQVLVMNAAPSFRTQPITQAKAGELYEYPIRLDDPGELDELRVLLDKAPGGMTLIEGRNDREWTLSWDISEDFEGGVDIELLAEDGRMGDEGWAPDGASSVQQFYLMVEPMELGGDGDGVGEGEGDAGLTGDGGFDMDSYSGSSCSCDLSGSSSGSVLFFLSLLFLGLRRRRR